MNTKVQILLPKLFFIFSGLKRFI